VFVVLVFMTKARLERPRPIRNALLVLLTALSAHSASFALCIAYTAIVVITICWSFQ
jgi:hypothetical protein